MNNDRHASSISLSLILWKRSLQRYWKSHSSISSAGQFTTIAAVSKLQIPLSHYLTFVTTAITTAFFVTATLSTAAVATEQLNINHATASQIESRLPGIGKVKAQAIVEYRNHNGPFDGPEQLLNIKGVGPHTLDRIRLLISFDGVRAQFFSHASQQDLSERDRAIRRSIKRIVTRAKQAAAQ